MSEERLDLFEVFHLYATTSQQHLGEQLPEVKEISVFDWDHYVSIMAFYLSLNKIREACPDEATHQAVLGDIYRRFVELFPDFINEKNKLMEFMDGKSFEQRDDFIGTLGIWLACSLYKETIHEVTPEQFKIGVLATEIIADDIVDYFSE